MMQKTHLAIAFCLIILAMPYFENKVTFFLVALFFSIIPDIDTANSRIGRSMFLRIFQFFTKHRGLLHSLTFAVFITAVFYMFIPNLAIPVLFGYSIHLILDTLTIEGTKPFWPFDIRIKGFIKTNSFLEQLSFFAFCFIDVVLIVVFIFEIVGI
jgi:membrane-bound metal-dependent hydrolase YbcI (DUF457 family)